MINARIFIANHIKDRTGYKVRQVRPEGNSSLPIVVYSEITNSNTRLWTDTIEYQFDVYASKYDEAVEMLDKVDEAITELGFMRTYTSSDLEAREESGVYHLLGSYRARVNTKTNRIYQTETRGI